MVITDFQNHKLNNLLLSNYSGSSIAANVFINRSGTNFYVAGSITIPSYSTLAVLGKDTGLYLEEGDVLQVNASANSSVHMVSGYEIIS